MTAPTVERTRWGAVVAVSLGVVLVALDMTVVAVALPTVGADFGAAPSATQWVLLAYSLPMVALSVPAGRWLDRAGPLPSFLVAVGGFGVTSVLIAIAPTFSLLLTARALQGGFGALVGVVAMPIVASSVRPDQRARAMSVVLTLIPVSGVAGPALGGILTDAFGWRSVFLVNIPVVAVAMWAGVRTIATRLPGRSGLPLPGKLLVREAAVLGIATTALLLALDLVGGSGTVVAAAVLAVVAVVALLVWRRLPESAPVRGLFARRRLALPLLALPLMTAGAGAVNFVVPYFLTEVQHASPSTVAIALLGLPAGMAAMSPVAGMIADRFGNHPVALTGAVLAVAGFVPLLFAGDGTSPLDLAGWLVVVGVGHGLFAGPNAAAILAHTPPELLGSSSGVSSLLRNLGFTVGPAIGAFTWTVTAGGAGGLVTTVAVCGLAAVLATVATAAQR